MSIHSPEPWKIVTHSDGEGDEYDIIADADGNTVIAGSAAAVGGALYGWLEVGDKDLDRIVACVNACQGLSAEVLIHMHDVAAESALTAAKEPKLRSKS